MSETLIQLIAEHTDVSEERLLLAMAIQREMMQELPWTRTASVAASNWRVYRIGEEQAGE